MTRPSSLPRCITTTIALLVIGLICPLVGRAAPTNLDPNPTQVDFGPRDVNAGSTPTTQIDFKNNTGADVTVLSDAAIGGADASQFFFTSNGCNPATIGDGNSCSVQVYFDPSAVASYSASVDLETDQGTVSVPLSGVGAAGTLSASPPNFNPQPYFYGSQFQSTNFTNTDPSYSVSSYSATITGADASFFSIADNNCSNQIQFPGNGCNIGVYFNPQAAGTKTAQLELSNSGTPDPVIVPLTATALAGPHAVATPTQHAFGNQAIGTSSAAQQITLQNQGDSPLQIQQLFIIGGAPNYFPITNETCAGRVLNPSESCTLDVQFAPGSTGPQNGSVFVITNENGPITQVNLSGTAYQSPTGGSVALRGTAMAGRELTCEPSGYPNGTTYSYAWLRSGSVVSGEGSETYMVRNGDVGARIACRVEASNPVGSEQATSPQSAVVAPASLVQIQDSLVARRVCRAVQAPARAGGASLSYGHPVTPDSPLGIRAHGKLSASLDGHSLGSGKGMLRVNPRKLGSYANGAHQLSVRARGATRSVQVVLGACQLAAQASVGRSATLQVSSAVGMNRLTMRLTRGVHFNRGKIRGRVYLQAYHQPQQSFLLRGAGTRSNGVHVAFRRGSVKVSGLPTNTGVVRLRLGRGSISGHRGRINARAHLKGTQGTRVAFAPVLSAR